MAFPGGALPDFAQPVLDYLSDTLPPPLYAVLVKVLSHTFAAVTSLVTICSTFLTDEDWDVQTLLPPILTLLAAYLALSSLYRTTTWLLRLTFWFMKWGTLLGIFFGGVGYLLGNEGGNGVGNHGRGGQGIGGLFATLLEDPRRPAKARTSKAKKTQPSKNKGKKPSAWDTFDRHREWQYQEDQGVQNTEDPIQKVFSAITNTAGNVLGGNWWEVAKAAAGAGDAGGSSSDKKASAKSKEKAKAGKARAR